MPKLKQINASHRFTKLAGPDLLSRLAAVGKGLLGNPAYPNPPVEPAALKAAGEKYSAAIADALDGGKKAITERNKQRESVIQMLLLLARYVETNCKNDMGTFLSSGFEAASTTRTPPQPLTQPKIRKIAHGGTGELLVSVTPVKNAYSYEVRYAAANRRRDATCMDDHRVYECKISHSGKQSNTRHDLYVSGPCLRPGGLHRMERRDHAYVHLTGC